VLVPEKGVRDVDGHEKDYFWPEHKFSGVPMMTSQPEISMSSATWVEHQWGETTVTVSSSKEITVLQLK